MRRALPWVPIGWVAAGAAILVASWRMDRLEQMHINPYSAPGLVPGVLGVLMSLFGAALAWREWRARPPGRATAHRVAEVPPPSHDARGSDALRHPAAEVPPPAHDAREGDALRHPVAVAALLCIGFVVALLGRGLPFAATSSLFVFAFIAAFCAPRWRRERRVARGVAAAAAIAIASGSATAWLFSAVFLVRLP